MALLKIGQTLRGRWGNYIVTKQLQETVWFAEIYTVVVKGVPGRHPCIKNERDEIQEPAEPPIIILKHLDDHLLNLSQTNAPLNRTELKYIARCILEALTLLHKDGYVPTDVKLDNIFVNYQKKNEDNMTNDRFSAVQLGDLGGCYPETSPYATSGTPVGAAMWSSPEVIMETPWNTATDICSSVSSTGGDFNLLRPRTVPYGHEECNLEVLKRQFRYFGPFPVKYADIVSRETAMAIMYLMQEIPKEKTTPFVRTTEREVSKNDNIFISKIMKMDWRDRPTAQDLLEDWWFRED
ncbi:putative serine/threonine protein kinase [Aspergillus ellipticus CBS 707.79]|uniref:Putative serine/threonine protein kinase n=1 Tax=Aspergillus ellipticus CBS 707.79 TaxID=1448320 RepID=A0A319D6Y9_9EURO|nr:putative serine/threonine protein kinase [Aspergillus ellipticus CBS 707.79]